PRPPRRRARRASRCGAAAPRAPRGAAPWVPARDRGRASQARRSASARRPVWCTRRRGRRRARPRRPPAPTRTDHHETSPGSWSRHSSGHRRRAAPRRRRLWTAGRDAAVGNQAAAVGAVRLDRPMTIVTSSPGVADLPGALEALRAWQHDGAVQLHPGDVGWFWRFGTEATAAAVRTWRRDGAVVAFGLLDGPRLLRVTTAPDLRDDEVLARRIADDVARPEHGVLPTGAVDVEVPPGAVLGDVLADLGWGAGETMTPLRRDLTGPVEEPGVRVEVVGPEHAEQRAAVQRAAFEGSTFTPERWHAMASGPLYTDARCLLAYDDAATPVATITVWSAGPG